MDNQFCEKYFELKNALVKAAQEAKDNGEVRGDHPAYKAALRAISEHLDGCGQCMGHLRSMAGLN